MKIYKISDILDSIEPVQHYIGILKRHQTQILNGRTDTIFIQSFGLLKEKDLMLLILKNTKFALSEFLP